MGRVGGVVVRTRIKVCGITRPDDGRFAAQTGADAIGLVFFAKSPRHVAVSVAREIIAALPPFTTSVGLFVDASVDEVETVLQQVPLDLLQFHGDESAEYCAAFGRPYLKAVRMRPDTDLHQLSEEYASAAGLLVDAYTPGVHGGTGATFDWCQVPADLASSLVLAGGLDATNVSDAIKRLCPYGVDVSSGVEVSRGIKSAEKMHAFIRAVHASDRARELEAGIAAKPIDSK